MISDDDIAAMPDGQRRDLMRRLAAASSSPAPAGPRRFGRDELHLTVLVVAAVLLVPWITYLAATLPDEFVAHNWRLAWVVFDLVLLAMFTATAVLTILRRRLAVLVGFALGVLLVCDAGFDLITTGRAGLWWALASAVVIELPLAALLMIEAYRGLTASYDTLSPGGPPD
ncbi:hypothetical protein [Actinoplanes sp. M2I2]|uniref:hypothetical protein n=1 Tax=Actinoplanes sp. M2I2 TaxID=1734444 RepID=UPI0020201EFE|nr:hypothetical protein [Actinoplanes sp. M2I2]